MMNERERALLVFTPSEQDETPLDIREGELRELTHTAGLEIVAEAVQRRRGNHRMLGRGKAEELALLIDADEIDVAIFDSSLSPSETRSMEEALGCKVIDRTALILDIFAQRARTREGKLQVEMAQLSWLLPRLTGKGTSLSRLGGGVGTRGPGETKLETDRRHIRRRLDHVRRELAEVSRQRALQRKARQKLPHPVVVLVGYTNAGKSSLLNRLSDSDIYVADQLFATLDPTTRRLTLPSGATVFAVDTVGFIRNLPSDLTLAFKATLEVLQEADMLLHVVDVAQEGYEERIDIVDRLIYELGCAEIPRHYLFNKIDLLDEWPPPSKGIALADVTYCSVQTNVGIDELYEVLEALAVPRIFEQIIELPQNETGAQLMAYAYAHGEVSEVVYDEDLIRFRLKGDARGLQAKFEAFQLQGKEATFE